MLLESRCLCSLCCPSSLWFVNFAFSLIFPKLSKEKVHFFVWQWAKKFAHEWENLWTYKHGVLLRPRSSVLWNKGIAKMSASRRCVRQRFASHSTASGRVFLGTSASSFRDLPRSPMARTPAKSGLQWVGICQGRGLPLPSWSGFSCVDLFVN